jgi:outer membrane lipoprotein-sorting protein
MGNQLSTNESRRWHMKLKTMGMVLICALLVVTGAACTTGGSTGGVVVDGMTGPEIMEKAIAAESDFETCRFLMEMVMIMEGMEMTMDASGAMDYPDEKMRIDMDMDVEVDMDMGMGTTVKGTTTMTAEMYAIDDWVYMTMDMSGMGMDIDFGWMKVQDTGDIWEEEDITGQQQELLEEYVSVTLLGSEKVNGADCYKLNVIPDMAAFLDWAQTQSEDLENLGTIDDFSLIVWIDKDTYFPVKSEIYLKGAVMEMAVEMTMSMLLWDFNKAVYISLPAEAENAMELDISEWETW